MSAEEYIAQYGDTLTEAEKRYIRAFGPPSGFHAGTALNPSTPNLRIGDASIDETHRGLPRLRDTWTGE